MLWDPTQAVPKLRPWLWVGLTVAVCLSQCGPFLNSLRPDIGQGNDFFQEWSSARNLLEGRPIYEETGVSVERYLGYHLAAGQRLTIRYNAHPPPSVLLAVPFALLDYRNATLAWNLVSLVAFGLSLQLVLRALQIRTSASAVFPLVTLLLLCDPLREQVRQGQLNCAILVLITGAWALERAQRPGWAGVMVGLATGIKLFPGFLLVYLGMRGRWRAVVAGAMTCLVLTMLTAGILGPGAYVDYASEVVPSLKQFGAWWPNSSVWGFSAKVFSPEPPASSFEQVATLGETVGDGSVTVGDNLPVYPRVPLYKSAFLSRGVAFLLALSMVAALGLVARRLGRAIDEDVGFSLAVTVMLLVAPITWPHYFLLLMLPWIVVWKRMASSAVARGAFLMLTLLLWVSPSALYTLAIPYTIHGGRPVWGLATPTHTLTVLSLQTYALVGLACWLMRLLRRAQADMG